MESGILWLAFIAYDKYTRNVTTEEYSAWNKERNNRIRYQ